jgi:hypothetical protein
MFIWWESHMLGKALVEVEYVAVIAETVKLLESVKMYGNCSVEVLGRKGL